MEIDQLIKTLQASVAPCLLISGFGFLLLTMTNRLGRVIDRARALAPKKSEKEHFVKEQLAILWVRARLLRAAILLVAVSALCSAVLVIVLFFVALLQIEAALIISGLFVGSMVSLVAALSVFIYDINCALAALQFELQYHDPTER